MKTSKRVPFGVVTGLLSKMEEIDFPISYTDGIKEIYFTYLKGSLHGDYCYNNKEVRISCSRRHREEMFKTFVHEVGHHIDSTEGFSDTDELIEESKDERFHQFMEEDMLVPAGLDGEHGTCEYFAMGFELFYSYDNGPRALIKYPVLNDVITKLHKRVK